MAATPKGTPTKATKMRILTKVSGLALAKTTLSAHIVPHRSLKLILVVVRPQQIRESPLARGADHKVRITHLLRIHVPGQVLFIKIGNINTTLNRCTHSIQHFRPSTVIERDKQSHARIPLRPRLGLNHLPCKGRIQVPPSAQEYYLHTLFIEFWHFLLNHLLKKFEKPLYFVWFTTPILGGKRVHSQLAYAKLQSGLHSPLERTSTFSVSQEHRQSPPGGPTTIPVHDDPDVARNSFSRNLLAFKKRIFTASTAKILPPTPYPHQTSRISSSLRRRSSFNLCMCSSVSFWTSSSARCSSSSDTSPSFFSVLRSCMTSRRTLRTATRLSSARPRTTRTSSFRRSSVRGGIFNRTVLPSTLGFRMRSDSCSAFTTPSTDDLS